MDEVDFHREYYKILDVVKEMEDGHTKKSMMLMLQLMQGLLEMILEMQVEEDDE
jgi:ACT domain-containing protein